MKRHTLLAFFCIVSLIIVAREALPQIAISAKVTPSTFNIPGRTAAIQNIFYTFTTVPAADRVPSSQAQLLSGQLTCPFLNRSEVVTEEHPSV
jgi:hypothetical protein